MRREILVCCEDLAHAGAYVEALKTAGAPSAAIRVLIPEDRGPELRQLAARAAGLLLCGGPDVEPHRYGQEPLPDAGLHLFPELDELEWELLAGARQGATPVWAICRGMQSLNAFLGGSLFQDLPLQLPGSVEHQVPEPRDALAHTVEVQDGEHPLGRLLGREPPGVNSRHHQAIQDLAAGLIVVGRSADRIIEAVATPAGGWWVQGVQWHPENLMALPLQRRLWEEFVAAAKLQDGSPNGRTAGPPGS